MSKAPLHELVARYLMSRMGERLTVDEIAAGVIATHPDRFGAKKVNLGSDKALLSQVTREIYAQRPALLRRHRKVFTDESRSPIVLFAEEDENGEGGAGTAVVEAAPGAPRSSGEGEGEAAEAQREADLYEPIREYLAEELGILTRRIRESVSTNRRGPKGNKWLHPDIVGMRSPSNSWTPLVQECASNLPTRKAELVAIEVKVRLTASNLREAFFQTVSNSLWANYAYLVATEVKGDETYKELQMLCALHGIGFLAFDTTTIGASRVAIPPRKREEVDWASVNRIAQENADFRDYLDRVLNYLKTGRPLPGLWAG